VKPLEPVGLVLEGAYEIRAAEKAVMHRAELAGDDLRDIYEQVAMALDTQASAEEHSPAPHDQVVESRFPEQMGAALILGALLQARETHPDEVIRQAAGTMIAEYSEAQMGMIIGDIPGFDEPQAT
jgi:hypothetical protein